MNEFNSGTILLICLSFLTGIVCLIASQSILPENCLLYEYRQIGLMCDGIDLNSPMPCGICNDESNAALARILFGVGIGFLIAPLIVGWFRDKHERNPEPTKLFE